MIDTIWETCWLLKNQQDSIDADYFIFATEEDAAAYAVENEYFSDCYSKQAWIDHYDEIIFPATEIDFEGCMILNMMNPKPMIISNNQSTRGNG